MFNVGDLVIYSAGGFDYGITNEKALCRCTSINDNSLNFTVELVGTCNPINYENLGDEYNVVKEHFSAITVEEYKARFPEAVIIEGLNDTSTATPTETAPTEIAPTVELKLNTDEKFVLSDEMRTELKEEISELLLEYGYHPTNHGIDAILDEWEKNKGGLIMAMQNHPNYNGKFQIAFDSDFSRETNDDVIHSFIQKAKDAVKMPKPVKLGAFTWKEANEYRSRVVEKYRYYTYLKELGEPMQDKVEEFYLEKKRWEEIYRQFSKMSDEGKIEWDYNNGFIKSEIELFRSIKVAFDKLYYYCENTLDEEITEELNYCCPELRAHKGRKTSKVVNKLCKLCGIDKETWYNQEFAKFSDAINPLKVKRHTVLSAHPVDYFTMSFGNSWASCQTIDKNNRRGMPDNYSGCYSAGTMSYMLDGTSLVFYTVDSEYDGDKLELQDKINRNMFHVGNNIVVQGRVYPQGTDGKRNVYKDFREIVQKIIADCYDVPNLWRNVKGTYECGEMIYSYGRHYRDYTNFSDCNVSYLKGAPSYQQINVGHYAICPSCGEEHDEEETIECGDCYNPHYCAYCGCVEDDMHYIDGSWYCEDHCFYCRYHEEWEAGDSYYVERYGDVCDYAINHSDSFNYCENCGAYYYYDDGVYTADGSYFCSNECAEHAGYVYVEDREDWYYHDETVECEECGCIVHTDNYNFELNRCNDCIEADEEIA